ncbi:MAG: zinc ribbon domain-containing protein [Firmicutes bacterium]|nr:zinc ribbon domain-containing protein [Lachnospiraceae bacterium]MBQ7057685.1 zinc ribbon domain-containing protein [Bacillota bacterium]
MFCQYCGAQIPDDSAFCNACGRRQQTVQQPRRQDAPAAYQQAQPAYQQSMPGMKWHKFLAYFALWLGALSNLVTGITYLSEYDTIQKVYGGFAIVLAVLGVMTAVKLIKFKADAPKTLHHLLLLSVVGSFAFTLWAAGVFSGYGIDFGDRDTVAALLSFVISLVIVLINKSYYNKRAYLFTR